jgi:hypothetical protein
LKQDFERFIQDKHGTALLSAYVPTAQGFLTEVNDALPLELLLPFVRYKTEHGNPVTIQAAYRLLGELANAAGNLITPTVQS